ncbi:MAG TPA: lyase family protein [Pyrinomonadaceae bacterium]
MSPCTQKNETYLNRSADSFFRKKAKEFAAVKKSGRTRLHDAVPITLGEEFGAYAENLRRAARRLEDCEPALLEIQLGGTAVGTGINAHPDYAPRAVKKLARLTGLDPREAKNKIASQQSLGDFLAVSSALRGLCVELNKICNDLRLLNSGPHTGFYEIELPAMQPDSSIMPGKVNPAMAEMVNMVCFHVIGRVRGARDVRRSRAARSQRHDAVRRLRAFRGFRRADRSARNLPRKMRARNQGAPEICANFAERSVGQAALLNGERGFMGAAEIAMGAIEENKSVPETLGEKKLNK